MNPSEPIEKPVLLEDVAKYIGVCPKTVTRLKNTGKLKAFKFGGQWFTRWSFVEIYIQQQLKKTQGRQPC
jgi:hypothetical protein